MRSPKLYRNSSAVLLAGLVAAAVAGAQDGAAPPIAPERVPAATPGATAPDGGRQISGESLLNEAYEVYSGLDTGLRVRHFVQRAYRLLRGQGVSVDQADFETINDALDDITYARDPRERDARQRDLDLHLHLLKQRVAGLIPPVCAFDKQNDDGTGVIVFWRPVAGATNYVLEGREFRRDAPGEPEWRKLSEPGAARFAEDKPLKVYPGREYQFRLAVVKGDGPPEPVGVTERIWAHRNWFSWTKVYYLLFVAILCISVVVYIGLAQRGVELRIRKIAGLEAVDEAVGRATEMGRPVLFIAGIQDMDNIQTVAGLTVLGRVARTAAEHDALLEVPTSRSLVMTAARETVHTAFLNAGRPDAYNEKKIYYVTDEQFGFVAATTGLIVREKPAACIYMGAFFAESLILAETANTVGSIQIAGTAEPAQLPFFVAACDYTLIGEEFFAASAYLSGEPRQLGSLKGQDIGKAIVMIVTLFATAVLTLAVLFQRENSFLGDIVDFIRGSVLNVAD